MAGRPAKGPVPTPPLEEAGLGLATKTGRPLQRDIKPSKLLTTRDSTYIDNNDFSFAQYITVV